MKHINYLLLLLFTIILCDCNQSNTPNNNGECIDFKELKDTKLTDIISEKSYIKLESSDSSLIGFINQIEIFKDRIYILDRDKTNSLFIFSIEGKFITKLDGEGNGPGEFITPHSFKIDKRGYLFILDRTLNRLIKYRLNDLKYIEDISLPEVSPLSFSILENEDLFIYYYSLRKNNKFNNKQIVIANQGGEIINTLYDAPESGKILHGNPNNLYQFKEHIRFYPYFENKIYELQKDSLNICYNLFWRDYTLPEKQIFTKHNNSGDIMNEILTGDKDWIRLLYIYETNNTLMVKYYIKSELYLAYLNKLSNKIIHCKIDNIIDDIGIGGHFPAPLGVYNQKIIGSIDCSNISFDKIKDKFFLQLSNNITEESNPILVLYTPL